MKYICVQPRLLYYAWQVEVMINNFLSNGIPPEDIQILAAYNLNDDTSSPANIEVWHRLIQHYNRVEFYFYEDTRVQPIKYVSSVRPNILKQHYWKHPELSKEAIFYHDCDIVFTKPTDFTPLLNDSVWYVSDTNSYINYDYINSKGHGIYDKMCQIIGIDRNIPIQNNRHSGGAQYIIKNVNYAFWDKVERDSEELFYQINRINNEIKKESPKYHELQIWCADMWAVLWNGWFFGHDIKVTPELDFCWATDGINKWNECSRYHNAGAVSSNHGYFYKADYMNQLPYNMALENISNAFASYNYVKELVKLKNTTCLK